MAQYFAPADPQDQTYNVLGTILGGLGGYAVHEYQKPERIKHFKEAGATDAEAQILVNMPVQQQSQWMQQKMKMKREEEKNAILGRILGGGQSSIENQPIGIPGGDINQRLMNLGNPIQLPGQMQQQEQPATPLFTKEQEKQIVQKSKNLSPEQIDQVLRSGQFNLNEINQIKGIIDRERSLELKKQIHEENKTSKEKALASKEKQQAFKMTEPFRAEAFKEEENARHMQDVIGEQLTLSKSGKMNNAGFLEFLERFGLDFNALKNPKTEQYQSLEKEYLKDLKSIFGGKISNDEMKAFLKGIPKATNSPQAREAMLDRWRSYYEAKGLKAKLIREITAENGGIPPYDLRDKVSERLNIEQEKLANRFLGIPEGAELLYDKKTGQRAYIKNGKIVELS